MRGFTKCGESFQKFWYTRKLVGEASSKHIGKSKNFCEKICVFLSEFQKEAIEKFGGSFYIFSKIVEET